MLCQLRSWGNPARKSKIRPYWCRTAAGFCIPASHWGCVSGTISFCDTSGCPCHPDLSTRALLAWGLAFAPCLKEQTLGSTSGAGWLHQQLLRMVGIGLLWQEYPSTAGRYHSDVLMATPSPACSLQPWLTACVCTFVPRGEAREEQEQRFRLEPSVPQPCRYLPATLLKDFFRIGLELCDFPSAQLEILLICLPQQAFKLTVQLIIY